MALVRGAAPPERVLNQYATKLAGEKEEDVIAAIHAIEDLPRREGELAFPEIGTLLSMVGVMRTSRHNREGDQRGVYQQQVCPDCGGVVGMMRPAGEQFRTWCAPCKAYRKIIPEDLTLTSGEWNLICAELDLGYEDWKRRGALVHEHIDPQVDREQFRGRA